MNINNFDSIIFDLGGVIWNISYQATSDAFIKLGFTDFNNWYSQANQKDLFNKIETGKISENDFYNEIRKVSGLNLSNSEIENAWNAMLLDLPTERIALISEIAKKKPIYLLSNTNEIHLKKIEELLKNKETNWDRFCGIFTKVYLSCRVGMRKPNEDIFLKVLNDNNLNASKTLFIEDSIQHIETANKIGIQTLFLQPNPANQKTIISELVI
jgi:putative hydrolase of the HAD superfamily